MNRSMQNALIAGVALSVIWTLPAAAQRRGDRDFTNGPTSNQIVDMADARIATLKADLRLTPDEEKNWGGFRSAIHDIAVARADELKKLRDGRTAANSEAPANSTAATTPADNAPANGSADTSVPAQSRPAADTTANNADVRDSDMQDRGSRNRQPDDIQSLRGRADALTRRADELKKIADAAQPLYASLDDTQRSQLMSFIRSNGAQDQATQRRRRRR